MRERGRDPENSVHCQSQDGADRLKGSRPGKQQLDSNIHTATIIIVADLSVAAPVERCSSEEAGSSLVPRTAGIHRIAE